MNKGVAVGLNISVNVDLTPRTRIRVFVSTSVMRACAR
jgi:hypothetical protein